MAMYCQNMLEIAIELTLHNASYEGDGAQVRRAFLVDRGSMDRMGEDQENVG